MLDFVRRGVGHGIVEATAGSGKTTTLVMVAQLLVTEPAARGSRACFLAFNRSTAAELRARLPPAVEAQTLHSLGRQVLVRARPAAVELEEAKYRRLAADLLRASPDASLAKAPDAPELADHLNALFAYARLELTDLQDAAAVAALCRRYHLSAPRPAGELAALHGLLPALAAAGSTATTVDYTDMLYLPTKLPLAVPRFSFLCVDEAQDLSPLALALVSRLIAAGARALFVGDPYQAIYAFAGADARSLQRIADLTSATRLPLSVSFRCPSRHVALARRFSPEMQAAPGASSGLVRLANLADLPRLAQPGDLIMARTNAPLPPLALELVAAGRAVRLLGHDLAGPAKELASALFTDTSPRDRSAAAILDHSLESERLRLEGEYLTSERLPDELERSRLAHEALRFGLRALSSGRHDRTGGDLETIIDELFNAGRDHVLLSTIHRAKGREAETTFILKPELLGQAAAVQAAAVPTEVPGAAQQPPSDDELSEANVLFVALTRSKRELVMVQGEPGAIAARLAAAEAPRGGAPGAGAARTDTPGSLERKWNDVLRLALIMSEAASEPGLSSKHAKTRRVQVRWRKTGGSRRRADRRRDRQRGDNR